MSLTVYDGATITKDPSDVIVQHFDWDAENLAPGVTITSQTITASGLSGDTTTTPLTIDQVSRLTGDRKVQFRTTAGETGSLWRVTCRVVTSETPAQTKERSVFISVVER